MESDLILGRYRPLELAGSGGYASVLLAWDTRIQRRVAIKSLVLPPDKIPLGTHLAQENIPGIEEARVAALLQDPYIVGIYDCALEDNCVYIIMEYVDGLSLGSLLRNTEALLSLDIVAHIAASVARALSVAHENQVLHLDIKPDNIFIDRKGAIKVGDFGLARLSSSEGYEHACGGTIGYMPPEQMNLEELDERCDEWALSSLIYELIAGANPFRARDIEQAKKAIEDAELILPSLCREDLSPDIDNPIFFALDPNREERFASVREFAAELAPYLGSARRGKQQLAHIVKQLLDDEEEEAPGALQLSYDESEAFDSKSSPNTEEGEETWGEPLLERLARGASLLLSTNYLRLFVALNCGLCALVVAPYNPLVQALSIPFAFELTGFVTGLVGVILPSVGLALALVSLSLALIGQGLWVAGAPPLLALGLWLWYVRGTGLEGSAVVLSSFCLGALSCGLALPFVAGFFSRKPQQSIVHTAFALFLSLFFALGGSGNLFAWNVQAPLFGWLEDPWLHLNFVLMRPSNWVFAALMLASAPLLTLCINHRLRVFRYGGIVLVTAVLLIAYVFVYQSSQLTWQLATIALGAGLCLLGVFVRSRLEWL